MKINTIILFGLFFISQCANCQVYHIHHNNTDVQTRNKLSALISTLKARNSSISSTNAKLLKAISDHKDQLRKNYTRNSYDKQDNFLASSIGSASLSLATNILADYPLLPYMTSAKRDYLKELSMDKAVLLSLQYIDASKIKAGHRQEIYRLRRELIRQFSRNDREAREMLLLSAAAMALFGLEGHAELLNVLNATEIAL
jgi:hypothetical protein